MLLAFLTTVTDSRQEGRVYFLSWRLETLAALEAWWWQRSVTYTLVEEGEREMQLWIGLLPSPFYSGSSPSALLLPPRGRLTQISSAVLEVITWTLEIIHHNKKPTRHGPEKVQLINGA